MDKVYIQEIFKITFNRHNQHLYLLLHKHLFTHEITPFYTIIVRALHINASTNIIDDSWNFIFIKLSV